LYLYQIFLAVFVDFFLSLYQLHIFEGDKLLSLEQQCYLSHDITHRRSMIRVQVLGAM